MNFAPLAPSFGAEVSDLDLTSDLGASSAQELRSAFARFHLLVFREQRVSADRHVEIASLFGPVLEERGVRVGFVSNVRADGITPEGALLFHSDLAFTPEPIPGLSLHALEIPSNGSPTCFASAARAAATLPCELRARVEAKRAVNVYGFTLPYDRRMRERELPLGSPVTSHPVVMRHSLAGEEVLMVSELHTDRIDGLPEHDSEAVLDELFAVLYTPEHQYRHHWVVGDLLIWNNLMLQHARPAFPPTEARTLQRVTIAERGTFDLVPNLEMLLR
jgi:taurine dioxygenase